MKILTSLAIWGPGTGPSNNQTGPILVHIYPLIYINLHVKYGSNLIRTFWVKIQNMKKKNHFFEVMLGQGYRGAPKCQQMQTSSQWRHMYNKGKQLKLVFHITMGQNVKNCIFIPLKVKSMSQTFQGVVS